MCFIFHGFMIGFDDQSQPCPKSSGSVWGMWGRLDAVRQDVGEDLMEQDYPTIFGERASWSSDHS